ncbi:MAG: helix-turn-helix transcriptional regulator [Treponema sp.]|nr:helix-turn-helix transcriptional regulator [Treponema sp.]
MIVNWRIETGKKIPSLPVLSKIAACFGFSLSEFISIVESRIS